MERRNMASDDGRDDGDGRHGNEEGMTWTT